MKLSTDAFASGDRMPAQHSRERGDRSPPFVWRDVPEQADSLVLLCEDPDAPGDEPFVHWLVYDIPTDESSVPEGGPVPGIEGINGFGEQGYGGPRPPKEDGPHHYHFRLYAVDRVLGLPPGACRKDVVRAMEGHALAQAEWIGLYERDGPGE